MRYLMVLGILLFTVSLSADTIIVSKDVILKTSLTDTINTRIALIDKALSDTEKQVVANKIVDEEIVKPIMVVAESITPIKIAATPKIETLRFTWKDVMVGGLNSIIDGKLVVVPITEWRIISEYK